MQPGKSVRFGRSAVPFGGSLRSEEPQAAVLKKSTHLHSEAELESVGVCHSWASLCVLVGLLAPSGGRFAPRCGGLATAQFVEGKPSAHKPHCTAVGLPFCAYSRQLSIPCSCATVAAFGAALHGNPSAVCASLCCSLRWGSLFCNYQRYGQKCPYLSTEHCVFVCSVQGTEKTISTRVPTEILFSLCFADLETVSMF